MPYCLPLGTFRKHAGLRKLNPGQQALLVLVYLRKGETFAEVECSGAGSAAVSYVSLHPII
jgi:hypothetical protein